MLENLEKLVRDQAQELVVSNSDVPVEHKDLAIKAAAESIFLSLQEQVLKFDVSALLDFFSPSPINGSHPIVKKTISRFAIKLCALEVSLGNAIAIGEVMIPAIMKKLIAQTNDPEDKTFNIKALLSQLAGQADGEFNLDELSNRFNEFKEGEN